MKRLLSAVFCFMCFTESYGQTGTRMYTTLLVEITQEKKPKKIFTKAQLTTAITGSDSSWLQSFQKKLDESLKVKNRAKAGKYLVSIRLLIERDGSLSDWQCLSDPGFGMCEQVVNALKRHFPHRWGPLGDSSGKVRQYYLSLSTSQNE